jgi:hypothetical protein
MGADRYMEERSSGRDYRDYRAHERITELEGKFDALKGYADDIDQAEADIDALTEIAEKLTDVCERQEKWIDRLQQRIITLESYFQQPL